jgi:hypothetical protein
MDVVLALEFIT